MDEKDIEHRLTSLEDRCKSNTHRINELSDDITAVNRLAVAVEVMTTKQTTMGDSVERLETKVDALEAKPGKRWDGLVDKLLFAAAGAVVAWVAAGMPGWGG